MTAIVVVLIGTWALYLYRQANIKRGKLRQKARQQYDDIATSINYWAESKDVPERFQLAQVALALYDDWHKRSTLLPVTTRNTSAEEFEVLTEWHKLIKDSTAKARNAWSGRPSDLLEMQYAENRAALRDYWTSPTPVDISDL